MRAKVVAAVAGLVLALGGLAMLGYGVIRLGNGPQSVGCSGDCLDDPMFIAFPGGIVSMVVGLIIASWALNSIRDDRGPAGPLRAFGFMSGLGGVFVALGAIFLVAWNSPQGGGEGAFLFLGGLFGIMGLAFIGVDLVRFRGELRKDRLRVSGLHGTARVVDVRDTNVTINNSPMVNLDLEVTLPGQAPFHARRRTVISRLSVGAMTPGAMIAVLADPARPRDIVLDWEGTPSVGGVGSTSGSDASAASGGAAMAQALRAFFPAGAGTGTTIHGTPGPMNAEILRRVSQALANAAARADGAIVTQTPDGTTVIDGGITITVNGRMVQASEPADAPIHDIPLPDATAPTAGLPARVSLDSIQDTGVDLAGDRLYAFDLTVSVAGRQPYQVKHAAVVPHERVTRLMQGASFPAQVDPDQPGQITILWDR